MGAAFQHLRSKHAEEELSPGGGKKEGGEEEEQSLRHGLVQKKNLIDA